MKKPATIFDHINHLTHKKKPWDKLSEADQKSFSPYIINRWLSMHMDITEIVDMFQQYTIGPLSKKHVYQLYYDILPKANIRAKYIKGKKQDKYNKELVIFIKDHYQISSIEAEDYIDVLIRSTKGLQSIVSALELYGKTEKEIKKLLK
tara:strand:+ start:824 stop:1270 length:447 start_codon:yes stop_codon:yes gene_type:complete